MLKLTNFFFFKNLNTYINNHCKRNNRKKMYKYHVIKHFYLVLKGKLRAYTLTKPNLIVNIVSILQTGTSKNINKFLKQFFFFKVNDTINRITSVFSKSSNF